MSIESRSRQYGVIFGHWQITKRLGAGSGGRTAVFQLRRTDGFSDASALKVINLIEEQGQLDEMSEDRRRDYENARNASSIRAAREVELMAELQSETNIVDYKDHGMVDWEDENGFGRDMLIRMELLEDLRSSIRSKGIFSEEQILHVGRDICRALILCHKKHILHRDIKPENIFVNKDGNYKLGDFGVSRILHAAPSAVADTGVGTPEYAAPEQFSGTYDTRVDIYSLGLVLYELSNRNRLPFAQSSYVRPEDVQKRQLAVTLPRPSDAGDGLTAVILKACARLPEDRFQTAEEFLHALQDPQRFFYENNPQGNQTVRAEAERKQNIPRSDWERGNEESKRGQEKQGNQDTFGKIIRLLAVLAAALVLAAVVLWVGGMPSAQTGEPSEPTEVLGDASIVTEAAEGSPLVEATEAGFDELSISNRLDLGAFHSVYLRDDGTLAATGSNDKSKYKDHGLRCDVSGWTDIISISASTHTLGLTKDGMVRATGVDRYGQCSVEGWSDIVAISAGDNHSLGVRSDGTVVAAGYNNYGQCDLQQWRDVIQVAAGTETSYGLRSNGTVLAAGSSRGGQTGINAWSDIISISAGSYFVVGLKSDGTIITAGISEAWADEYSTWTDIVAVCAGSAHIVAVRSDGTVVACGDGSYGQCDVSSWTDIVSVGAGMYHTIGMKRDGTLVGAGHNAYGQLDLINYV